MPIFASIPKGATPYEFETLTVSTSAQTLTETKWKQRGTEAVRNLGNARFVLISVSADKVRVRLDGTAPTSSVGHEMAVGDSILLSSEEQFKDFKVIRSGSADANVSVTYLR